MNALLADYAKVKLSVDDFDRLAEIGGLAGLERTELLDGDIYAMSPQYRPHAFAKSVFYDALLDWTRIYRPDLSVLSEASVAMPPNDEPIPDVILTNEPRGHRAIPVESVALLVEIADESRVRDLGYKAPLYAAQGVPEYWVVDLPQRTVVQHSEPEIKGYGKIARIEFGEMVVAVTLLSLEIATTRLG